MQSHRSHLLHRVPPLRPQSKDPVQLGRDSLPCRPCLMSPAATTRPKGHHQASSTRTEPGGWSWLPGNFDADSTFGRGLHISSARTPGSAGDNAVFCRCRLWLTTVRLVGQGIKTSIRFQCMAGHYFGMSRTSLSPVQGTSRMLFTKRQSQFTPDVVYIAVMKKHDGHDPSIGFFHHRKYETGFLAYTEFTSGPDGQARTK